MDRMSREMKDRKEKDSLEVLKKCDRGKREAKWKVREINNREKEEKGKIQREKWQKKKEESLRSTLTSPPTFP